MPLHLYNTLTRKKELFEPIDRNNVRMYVCGPTVYDFAHIGNARPVIVFDVLYRLLKHLAAKGEWDNGKGLTKVTYVRNITDVDDKINDRALRDFGKEIAAGEITLNQAIRKVTDSTANQFFADAAALGCLSPDFEPRATEHIDDMIALIQKLLDNGHAYLAVGAEGMEVLFSTISMKEYGALSNRNLSEQQAGARVSVEAHKKAPSDFVLWKESSSQQPGWNASFTVAGDFPNNQKVVSVRGRPGWHIECSAMSWKKLGPTFDIHGGGLDLIFPHHENEIAQSRCAHGTDVMANVWMHNGFLQVEGQKMSKSLGNFYSISEMLEGEKFGGRRWHGAVLRLAMLKTHYRKPIDWTYKSLQEADYNLRELAVTVAFRQTSPSNSSRNPVKQAFVEALKDDLNVWEALSILLSNYNNLSGSAIVELLGFIGIDLEEYDRAEGVSKSVAEAREAKSEDPEIDTLIEARNAARAAKDWKKSDDIRVELDAMGVAIKDNKDGTTTWEVKR
jgi:cysteinyl-tRNA synthetase